MRTKPSTRISPGFGIVPVALFLTVFLVGTKIHAQEGNSSPGGFVIEGLQAEPVAEPVDPEAIPRFEDTPALPQAAAPLRAMPIDDAGAVEIPEELLGDEPAVPRPESEPLAADADVEEKVDEKDSTVKKMVEIAPDQTPVMAEDLRAQSPPEKPGQVGSTVHTRKEARTFTFSIPAPRGQILDRNGYPLAQSKVAYYAAITFPFLGSAVSDGEVLRYAGERMVHVNNILGTDWDLSGKVVIDHYRDRRWIPLTFSSVLSDSEVDELNRQKMEGLTLQPVYLRHYPQGTTLSHVIGYVGKRPPRIKGPIVNEESLWGLPIGVDGLEQSFEPDLRGTPGRVNVVFEADGTKVKEEVLSRPRPGFNVVTSIDLEMQQICERLLEEKVKRGAMVIMDVRNGDIMAMASNPQFDPNDFIPAITQAKYTALAEDPAKPLFPRAYRASYPPASTFKAAVALGFLESGYISPNDLYPCPNAWKVGDLLMRNWNVKGEGSMNVVGALTRSCNTWFYEVASRAGADSMSYMATRLGLGQKTGIPLNEAEGFIPSNRYWLDKHGYMMSDGEEAVMSIGQGTVEVTPLQVARMMAAIGNGQQVVKPRLVLQIQDVNHELERTFPVEVANSLNVDSYSLRAVQRGLYDVVNAGNGTGKAAYHKITVSGKTGTGQWKPAQKQNLSWFAGYFPSKNPVYSFAVIYEGDPGEVVSGGKQTAPVVGAFLEEYLNEENYNTVRARANLLEEETTAAEPEEYTSREPVQSIFQDGEAEAALEEIAPVQPEPTAQQRPEGGGLFQRIFKRKRQ
jgi:penicillin-binding protein 2